MLYTHDSYGLGHLRRTLVLSRFLADRWPDSARLIATGSPVAERFVRAGEATLVPLPPVRKTGEDTYEARDGAMPFAEISARRGAILLRAAREFAPDILVVDHAPAGLHGELRDALDFLASGPRRARLVLSLRDVVDGAPLVRELWRRDRIHALLDERYDAIVVYGVRELYDAAREYGLSPRASARTHHVGYLRRVPGTPLAAPVDREGRAIPRVVVTAGSGEDGLALYRVAIEALGGSIGPPPGRVTVIGGPLLSAADRITLRALAAPWEAAVQVVEEVSDAFEPIEAADVVVSMAGFNSICEIFSAARPAVVVPRAVRSFEQRTRAEFLSARGIVRRLIQPELTPDRLRDEVTGLLDGRRRVGPPPPLGGLEGFAAVLDALRADRA
jgi:predicted glycosyltransferase